MATSSTSNVGIDSQSSTKETPLTAGNPDVVDSKTPLYLSWLQQQGPVSHQSTTLKAQLLPLSNSNIVEQFIDQWVSNQLKDYINAFTKPTDGNLTNIQKRFDWITTWLDQYTINYASIFPPKWHVAMRFAIAWCETTNRHLVTVMEGMHPDTLTAQTLKPALKATRAFEQTIGIRFSPHLMNAVSVLDKLLGFEPFVPTTPTNHNQRDAQKKLNAANDQLEALKSETNHFFSEAPLDVPYDQLPSSITEVLVQLMPADHPSLTPPTISTQPCFDRLISQCFDGYLTLITDAETKQMDQMYQNIMMNAQWAIDAASTSRIFPSARCLLDLIYASREKLSAIDNPMVVIDIVSCYKRLLIDYHRSLGDQVYKMSNKAWLCWIINTSEYVLASIRSLTIGLKHTTHVDFKDAVSLQEVYDMYRMLVTRVVHTLTVDISHAIHIPRWPDMSNIKLNVASTNMYIALESAINSLQQDLVDIEKLFNLCDCGNDSVSTDMPNRKNHFAPICNALVSIVAQKVMDRISDVSEKTLPPDEYARFIQVVDAIENMLCVMPTMYLSVPDLKGPYLLDSDAFVAMVKQKLMPVRQVLNVLSVPLNTIRYALSMIDFTMTSSTKQ